MSDDLPPLWEHQKTAVVRAEDLKGFGLFFDMGTGKTRTAIEILMRDFLVHGELKTMIICPLVVRGNWKNELIKYSRGFILEDDIEILDGTIASRTNKISKDYKRKHKVYICNYESFANDTFVNTAKMAGFKAFILDESHRIKSPDAKRTKNLLNLVCNNPQIKRVLLLSGTPLLQSIEDLFTQSKLLDGGLRLGHNFFSFKSRFMYDANASKKSWMQRYFPDWKPRPGALEEITKLMAPITMSVAKSQCLDLPPLTRKVIEVELTKEQKNIYDQVKKNLIAEFSNGSVTTTPLALTKTLRLLQWTSGFMPSVSIDGGEVQIQTPGTNPRLEALRQILEGCVDSHKVIVWAAWNVNIKEISLLLENLKIKFVRIDGSVTGAAREKAIEEFRQDKEVRVFLGNPSAGGIGINLIESSVSIYYSRSFNLEHDLQSEARNYRGGSEIHESITRIDIVAKGTIDEYVMEALKNKKAIGDQVLEAIKYGE